MQHRGGGMVGYNVQAAVDTQHHLIVSLEVTTVGNNSRQLAIHQQASLSITTKSCFLNFFASDNHRQ